MDKNSWVITDCGSTTSKTIVFTKVDATWKMKDWAVSPTTVEVPYADVTVGVAATCAALKAKGALHESDFTDSFPTQYLATSSAGGGLRIAIVGLTKEISGDLLSLAALHSGAIVSGMVTLDDGLSEEGRILKLRNATPDIILLAAGIKNATPAAFADLIILLKEAALRSRLGEDIKIPIIFAGSRKLLPELSLIENEYVIQLAEEIAPSIDKSELLPTEEAIHELFLTSVMEHAPGYKKLLSHTAYPIIPTPLAVADALALASEDQNEKILCIDIGGATTDIFSTAHGSIQRTVSSNVGMSYSSYYVFQAAGVKAFRAFLPETISDKQIEESIFNKMLRPTTLPASEEEQQIEFALCRVGISLAYKAHTDIVYRSKNVRGLQSLVSVFTQNEKQKKAQFDRIIASGGVFSHCPTPDEIPWILADALPLQGMTQIVVDTIFMLPHLGILSHIDVSASKQLLASDCLSTIGVIVVMTLKGSIIVNGKQITFDKKKINQCIEIPEPIKHISYNGIDRTFDGSTHKLFLRQGGIK